MRDVKRTTRAELIMNWILLVLCGGFVLWTLLEDATDGTALVVFSTVPELSRLSWVTVLAAVIATLAAASLAAYYRDRARSKT